MLTHIIGFIFIASATAVVVAVIVDHKCKKEIPRQVELPQMDVPPEMMRRKKKTNPAIPERDLLQFGRRRLTEEENLMVQRERSIRLACIK